jgi:uncharacterized protein
VTLVDDLLLVGAGAVASSVNAAAGGGTLLSFPALLAAGLDPLAANATSAVGLLPGGFGSVFGLREDLRAQRSDATLVAAPSLLGGICGALLLLWMGGKAFAAVVPALLLGASALLMAQPLIARFLQREGPPRDASKPVLALANFAIAVYGGYFGAMGILYLGAMGLFMAHDLRRVNNLKVLTNVLANGLGVATFVVAEILFHPGALVPRAALPLAVGAILGGYYGVRIVRRLPPQGLRWFASLVGLGIAVWFVCRR